MTCVCILYIFYFVYYIFPEQFDMIQFPSSSILYISRAVLRRQPSQRSRGEGSGGGGVIGKEKEERGEGRREEQQQRGRGVERGKRERGKERKRGERRIRRG